MLLHLSLRICTWRVDVRLSDDSVTLGCERVSRSQGVIWYATDWPHGCCPRRQEPRLLCTESSASFAFGFQPAAHSCRCWSPPIRPSSRPNPARPTMSYCAGQCRPTRASRDTEYMTDQPRGRTASRSMSVGSIVRLWRGSSTTYTQPPRSVRRTTWQSPPTIRRLLRACIRTRS